MSTTTIRVSTHLRDQISAIATASGVSMQEIVERSLEMVRRTKLLEGVNNAYAELRQNESAWQTLKDEQSQWENTVNDGLKAE